MTRRTTMMNNESALKFVLLQEGGYSNDGADSGGATNYGITQTEYNADRVKRRLPIQSIRVITAEEVRSIYDRDYWQAGKCEQLPAPLDLVHFDGCVNIGIGGATRLLQKAVGSKVDGGFGPQTLKDVKCAMEDNDAKAIALNIIDLRREYYRRIVDRNATQGVFLKGWLNRCNALQLAVTHG